MDCGLEHGDARNLGNVMCWSSSGHDYKYRSGIKGRKWYKSHNQRSGTAS